MEPGKSTTSHYCLSRLRVYRFYDIIFKKTAVEFLAGNQGDSLVASILYYILILPLYNVILLGYGFLFGQFSFFWAFEKKLFKRLSSFRKTKK